MILWLQADMPIRQGTGQPPLLPGCIRPNARDHYSAAPIFLLIVRIGKKKTTSAL